MAMTKPLGKSWEQDSFYFATKVGIRLKKNQYCRRAVKKSGSLTIFVKGFEKKPNAQSAPKV